MIDILLFPDVGSTIPYGREGKRGGGRKRAQQGVLGAMKTCFKLTFESDGIVSRK